MDENPYQPPSVSDPKVPERRPAWYGVLFTLYKALVILIWAVIGVAIVVELLGR